MHLIRNRDELKQTIIEKIRYIESSLNTDTTLKHTAHTKGMLAGLDVALHLIEDWEKQDALDSTPNT